MHYSKPVDTPIKKGLILNLGQCLKTEQEKEKIEDVPHASVVGSLMYVMLCTGPDICFAVTFLSRYQNNSRLTH